MAASLVGSVWLIPVQIAECSLRWVWDSRSRLELRSLTAGGSHLVEVHGRKLLGPLSEDDGGCDRVSFASDLNGLQDHLPLRNFLLAYLRKNASCWTGPER